ncbi:MAG: BNR-4 repeat-containing protein [Halobacteriaceae archaeon]
METIGDGAWCWFQDPRALRRGDRTYAGWVTPGGDIAAGYRDHGTGARAAGLLHAGFERDDHDAPAFHATGDRLLAFYTRHNGPAIHWRALAPDTLAPGPERTLAPSTEHTYPNPRTLDGRLHLFYRNARGSVAYVVREDGAWSDERELVTTGGREWCVYAKLSAPADGRITLALTFAESGRHDPHRDVRVVTFDGAALRTVGGRRLGGAADGLPFREMPVVYDSDAGHDAWVWDCAGAPPEVVYATFPETDDHRYRYARWDGGEWHDERLADAGSHIVGDNDELYYSGGAALDGAGGVYASVGDHGGSELRHYERRGDGSGAEWAATTVARGEQNVRPVVPRNGPEEVCWLRGRYTHYADGDYEARVVSQR